MMQEFVLEAHLDFQSVCALAQILEDWEPSAQHWFIAVQMVLPKSLCFPLQDGK